jgi:hypothetical protein
MQSGGKSYIPLPHNLSISKSVINVKNKDEKGCLWSVLASLYPQRGSAHYFDYTSTTSLRGDVLLLIWLDGLETVAYLLIPDYSHKNIALFLKFCHILK